MRNLIFLAVFLFCGIGIAADVWENPSYVDAVKKYYELVDKAKLSYQNDLEKELAAAQRRGEIAQFNELEKELNHTKSNAGHAISAYVPKTQSLFNSKRQLQRAVENARSQFKRSTKNLAADLLKSGKTETAKMMDQAADAVEPPRVPGNVGDRLQRTVTKKHLDAVRIAFLNLPQVEPVADLSSQRNSWSGFGQFTLDSKKFVAVSHHAGGANVFNVETKKGVAKVKYPKKLDRTDIHPNGKFAASGAQDGKIIFWSLDDGSIFRTIDAHADGHLVHGIRFSGDGTLLASGSHDKTAAVWEVATDKELKRFAGHDGEIWAVDLTPDGRTLATSGNDGRIILWDVKSGKQLQVFGDRPFEIRALAFNRAGTIIAASHAADAIGLWDVRTGKQISLLEGCFGWPIAIDFSPDDSQLLVGCKTYQRTAIWDIASRLPVCGIPVWSGWIHTAKYSPDGKTIATCAHDPVQIWNAPTPQKLEQWKRELEAERNTGKEILLRKMPIEVAETGWWEPWCGPHSSGRKEFENTFWAHAPSKHVFRLGRKWKTLELSYGLIRNADLKVANCIFIVKADGRELFRSMPIRDHLDRPLSLDVRNVDRLELIVDPNGDQNQDQACWFEPKLKR